MAVAGQSCMITSHTFALYMLLPAVCCTQKPPCSVCVCGVCVCVCLRVCVRVCARACTCVCAQ